MKKIWNYISFVILLLLIMANVTFGQAKRDIPLGTMDFVADEAFSEDQIYWPIGWNYFNTDVLDASGVDIGVKMSWTDASGVKWPVKIAESVYRKFSDLEHVVMPLPGAFGRTFKYRPPHKVIDGKDWTNVLFDQDKVDQSIPSDVMIYNHCKTWVGIDIERWSYGFTDAKDQNYVILEYRFTNVSGEPRNDVYFGLRAELNTGSYYPGYLWSNYYGATYKDYVAGDPSADSMRVYYEWIGDQISATPNVDDRAFPDQIWGNFTKPQYLAAAVLHADKDVDDESDDPSEPIKAGWSQRELSPDLSVSNATDIYNFLSTPWDPKNPNLYTLGNGMYRVLPPSWDPTKDDPLTEQEKTGLFSFGPYQMKPGDDVRIVIAYAAGSISDRLAIDVGRAYNPGYQAMQPRVPMPYNIKDKEGNIAFNVKGKLLDRATKDAILNTGKDSVFAAIGEAIRIWKNSNVKYGQGTFDVARAPASPSLEVKSLPGEILLKWGTEAEQSGDVAGYRIYRSYWRPPSVTIPTDTTFILVKDIPGTNIHQYEDKDVIRGQNYYYYVTAYNTQGIESSALLNRTGAYKTGADKLQEAASPARPPDSQWKSHVVVVPNPYHARAMHKYEGAEIKFLNLPAYCNIYIYTMTGDKVQVLHHNTGTGDEPWERQETFSTMSIVSGIYIYVVQELDGPNGSPTGKFSTGKFIVVK